MVGALGEWCPNSMAVLNKLLKTSAIKHTRERIIAEAINGSAACYYKHTAQVDLVPAEYRRVCK